MNVKEIFIPIALSVFLAFGSSACLVVKKDNGKHKGWTKNSNNPHHPATTNPGHTKTKGKSGK